MDNTGNGHKELAGKVCLVTGGSRGIGRAIVTTLADEGADVAFTYQRSTEQADALVASVRQKGVRCQAYQADVASPEAMRAVAQKVIQEFGHVSILVNNAGINRDKSFLKMTKDMWDEVMRVNLDGVFHTTQPWRRIWWAPAGGGSSTSLRSWARRAISGSPTTPRRRGPSSR